MPILSLISKYLLRRRALFLLLLLAVLTALWQQTSASSVELPATATPFQPRPEAKSTATVAPPVVIPTPTTKPTPSLNPTSLTVVVNKQRALPLTYIPANLTVPNVPTRYGASAAQSHLRADAATALEQLFAAAARDGLNLQLLSGYRSAAYQTSVYQNALRASGQATADQAVARPGHSEHQTGLAVDVARPDHTCDLAACFGTTPEGLWLQDHAATYGFIIRYPAGRIHLTGYQYEPWHLRYVGPDVASHLYRSGQILEEYLSLPYAPGY